MIKLLLILMNSIFDLENENLTMEILFNIFKTDLMIKQSRINNLLPIYYFHIVYQIVKILVSINLLTRIFIFINCH